MERNRKDGRRRSDRPDVWYRDGTAFQKLRCSVQSQWYGQYADRYGKWYGRSVW